MKNRRAKQYQITGTYGIGNALHKMDSLWAYKNHDFIKGMKVLEWHVNIAGTFVIIKIVIKGMLDIIYGEAVFFLIKQCII